MLLLVLPVLTVCCCFNCAIFQCVFKKLRPVKVGTMHEHSNVDSHRCFQSFWLMRPQLRLRVCGICSEIHDYTKCCVNVISNVLTRIKHISHLRSDPTFHNFKMVPPCAYCHAGEVSSTLLLTKFPPW